MIQSRVLLIGANSDIGLSAGRLFQQQGCSLVFAAHKPDDLPDWAHPRLYLDLEDVDQAVVALRDIDCDIAVYCAGKLATNEACQDPKIAAAVRKVNFGAATVLLPLIAERMRSQKGGVIVGVSSVAADRGKASHRLYGAAKAGFDHFLNGLRQEYFGTGVRILTIRPGYVNTKMTAGLELPGMLTASKEQVAQKIVRHSLSGRRNIVYVKAIWRPLMWGLRHVPEFIFKRRRL